MSNALSSLFELQALDTQLLEKRRTVQRYQDELARRKAAMDACTARIEGLLAQRKEAVNARALAERRVEDLKEDLKQKKARSQKARNEREMHAGEGEVRGALEDIREAEDQQLDAMTKVEELEASVEAARRERAELETEDHRHVEEAQARIQALRAELEAAKAGRDQAASAIEPGLRKKYEFLLEKRAGLAVVEVDAGGCCGGCHVQVPPQTLLEVRRSGAIRVCPMCQRLLYASSGSEE